MSSYGEEIAAHPSVNSPDEHIRAVCLDIRTINGTCVAECYCRENRKIYQIRVPDGRVCKSWQLHFAVSTTDEDGISEVENYGVFEDSASDMSIEMGRDGIVRFKSFVGISYCPHHESYEGNIFWSEEFGRVLAGERDRAERLKIYSTWVERDSSENAKSYGVDFRICDHLKPVLDKAISERCRKRLLEDQDALYEKTHHIAKVPSPPSSQEMVQSPCSVNANLFVYREGRPRGNGLYAGSKFPQRLRSDKRAMMIKEYKKKESDNSLLLFIKKESRFSEAWGCSFGRVMVTNPFFEGSELKEGDWFYASVRLYQELYRGVEPIFIVKRIIELAYPLAYTDCFLNEIEIEIECQGKKRGNDSNGNVIFEHSTIGNIVMTPEQYNTIRLYRMVCSLQFNHKDPYHNPWKFVKSLRELPEFEEFPMLSPECRISDSERQRQRSQRMKRLANQQGRENANGEGARDNHKYGSSSSDILYGFNHRCPQVEEALDIIDHLLNLGEVVQTIQRRTPWLIRRMERFALLYENE